MVAVSCRPIMPMYIFGALKQFANHVIMIELFIASVLWDSSSSFLGSILFGQDDHLQ